MNLVAYHPKFHDVIFSWRSEATALRYNPIRELTSEAYAKIASAIGTDLSVLEAGKDYRWYVEIEGELVGHVSVKDINLMMMTAEVGYLITEKHYGRGIATQAVRKMIQMVFQQTSLRRLYASAHVDNVASHRVLEKVGFKKEGVLREHFMINGQAVDEVYYGLLRREFV